MAGHRAGPARRHRSGRSGRTSAPAEVPEVAAVDTLDTDCTAPRRRRLPAGALLPAGLVVVVAVLVTVLAVRRAPAAGDDEPALVAARQTVTDLLTIGPAAAQDTLARLTAGSTGEFACQLAGRSAGFVGAIRDAEVTSTGSVVAAGVAEHGPGRAVVLVSANSTVRNTQSPRVNPAGTGLD
ncbi:hypothetical protein [Pseudonocardia sp. HH130629-09]|uniref:hypothetical protein n=1 Tax=Pseudonocardia sp. HH130629-09 TaxID=1641402 RepID=UPI0007610F8D|nr:hypothetical protein [Pseudonocardia sp. HH130629-09]